MVTMSEWERAFYALNRGIQALEALMQARLLMDDVKVKEAIDKMSVELGECSEALRVLRPPRDT